MEDGKLTEVFWENPEATVGKICKGIVRDVIPGLSCVFVDIGQERNAFLHVGDTTVFKANRGARVQDVLKSGQEIMVQVKKEALAEKGARLTQEMSIPGRYLVLLPHHDRVSISRKITDSQQREELKQLLEEARPAGIGVIVRTVAVEAPAEEIVGELQRLVNTWLTVTEKFHTVGKPGVIYEDQKVVVRILRDYLNNETAAVIVNHAEWKETIQRLLESKPACPLRVKYEPGDLFARYGLDKELKRALKRRVWLKNGGYIIVDETEAMTVIDVNSGKFTGRSELEQTVVRTNLDAAREIPRQLRLRRIGGIILVDFIDMKEKEHQEQVIQCLRDELQKDKEHTRILGLTRLGLLEMTRKKSRYGLTDLFTDECAVCHGRGQTASVAAVANEIRRKLINLEHLQAQVITCHVNPEVARHLRKDENWLQFIEARLDKSIELIEESNYSPLEYEIGPRG